ncbi:MAG: hypothetical protein K6C94_07855 [Candidatus Gastranaerophilales bacterium]|nr:hypothetical protein [Candidatus Gastranaerophilales bacterium]
MYINKCTKCGTEFETKNPKRVICPACLYQDRAQTSEQAAQPAVHSEQEKNYSQSASFGGSEEREYQPRNYERNNYSRGNTYNRYERNDSYSRPQRSYGDRPQRSYGDRPQRSYDDRPQRSYGDRPQRSYGDRPQRNYGDRPQRSYGDRPQRSFNRPSNHYGNKRNNFNKKPVKQKQLLISKEQLEQIEFIYKKALPLPNHDIHEVIGNVLGIEPRKVFFGINLIRQKMMLPKLQFPKRKLAVTPDQLTAIKMLYEPLLPLPPIGCHKLIAAQLKMDEWRVHVGIGLIRKEMGLDRWNPDRPDAPKEYKK